jgi:hypothetical protein
VFKDNTYDHSESAYDGTRAYLNPPYMHISPSWIFHLKLAPPNEPRTFTSGHTLRLALFICQLCLIAPYSPQTDSPELVDADISTRYVLALYWATITVTTMGYGDITPATHEVRVPTHTPPPHRFQSNMTADPGVMERRRGVAKHKHGTATLQSLRVKPTSPLSVRVQLPRLPPCAGPFPSSHTNSCPFVSHSHFPFIIS